MRRKALLSITGAVALGAIALLLTPRTAAAAEVRLSIRSAEGEGNYDGALELQSRGEAVAGLQIELMYDASRFRIAIEPTPALTELGKRVMVAETEPGIVRALVIGENANALPDGLIVTLKLTRIDSSGEPPAVAMRDAIATSPQGDNVPVSLEGPNP